MKRLALSIASLALSIGCAFADYSSRGRPWDADDNYDSSSGIWIVLFIIVIGVVVIIVAAAKHTWDNYKNSIKDGFGIVASFGVCILLFLGAKACSESSSKNSNHTLTVHQVNTPFPQYEPTHTSNRQAIPEVNVNEMPHQDQPRFRTEYYDERCTQCNGSGSVVCLYCGGKGYVYVTCSSCKGRGSHHVRKTAIVIDGSWDTNETDEMCMSCFGSGSIKQRCNRCNSEYPYGNSLISTYMTCPTCHGQGVFHKSRQVPY